MKRTLTVVRNVFIAFVLFVLVVMGEAFSRSFARTSVPVIFEDGVQATGSAYVQPDFLWVGKAWIVRVECETPVSIDLDGEWKARVPSGTTAIYSNHDTDNTATFGSTGYHKVPSNITVSRIDPEG